MNKLNHDRNEILMIIIEKFSCNQMNLYDLIDDFILFKSKNDAYSIKIDINSQNITIFDGGYAIGYLSKYNLDHGYIDIDPETHRTILKHTIDHIKENQNIINEIKKKLNSYVVFEKYEEAVRIREFLKLFD